MRGSSSFSWWRRPKTAARAYEERRERRRRQQGQDLLALSVASIGDHDNLYDVYQKARQGGAASGIDGVTYADLSNSEVGQIMRKVSAAILNGTYRPHEARPVSIPKPGTGASRQLKIGVVCDRVVAKALYLRLKCHWEATFLPCSFGFREAIGPWQMLAVLEGQMVRQDRWVLAIDDVKNAFDNVPIEDVLTCHRRMLKSLPLPENVEDRAKAKQERERLMWLIETVVRGGDPQRSRGIDQGNPYSPVCLNALMHYGVDQPIMDMIGVPLQWFRYADNLVYLAASVSAGRSFLRLVRRLLEPLGLTLKGEDGVQNLARGKEVQLLGFSLRRKDNGVLYGLGKKALDHLTQNLGSAHDMPHPTSSARESLLGWVDAMGPAFENGVDDLSVVLNIAANNGFRELASSRELRRRWKRSWDRWQETRDRAYCSARG